MIGTADRHGRLLRAAVWAAAGALLLAPLVAMRLTDGVDWTSFDFAVAAALLGGAALVFDRVSRRGRGLTWTAGLGLAVATGLALVWVCLAVGFVGREGDPLDLLVLAVLGVAAAGAALVRLRPSGLSGVMLATAAAQLLVSLAATLLGRNPPWGPTAGFVVLWLAAAALFRRAARD
jgi:hypothetical protein